MTLEERITVHLGKSVRAWHDSQAARYHRETAPEVKRLIEAAYQQGKLDQRVNDAATRVVGFETRDGPNYDELLSGGREGKQP